MKTTDERTWAMLCHLSSFAGFIFPFGNILGPLIVWLIKKEEYPSVLDQGKEAVNFQISMTIYLVASIFLTFLLIGFPLLIIILLIDLIQTIKAIVATNKGEKYHYPFVIEFVK